MVRTLTQAEPWNGEAALRWVSHRAALDRVFAPLDQEALRRAAPTEGEHVLDVGCGCGGSTLALAAAVGESGSVLGVDVSGPMLQCARERAAGVTQVTFRQGDAGSYPYPRPVTLIYSRLGVMFFSDPPRAFAHLRGALALGGRLCFVCPRSLEQSPFHALPLRAAAPLLEVSGPAIGSGPFSLASEERIHALLSSAGFEDVQLQPFTTALPLGDLEQALALSTRALGPLPRALSAADERTRDAVVGAVREALRAHLHGDQVLLDTSVWIVHAR